MAAAPPTNFDEVLVQIGFNNAARDYMTDVDGENMTIASLLEYQEEGDFEALFASLRRPGGTMANPDAGTPGQPARIPNPGVKVSTRAIDNFKTGCFIAQHFQMAQRTAEHEFYTTARLRSWKLLRRQAETYKEPDEFPKLEKESPQTITDFIEEFEDLLSNFSGTGGRPLNYVIRQNVEVPPEDTQPVFGEADSPFVSIRHELCERSEVENGVAFAADNERVFEILKTAIFEFKPVYLQIRRFAREKNGRAAWDAFTMHYLGDAALEAITVKAENRIARSNYSGEKPRYTFETHVTVHQRAHMDIRRGEGQEWDDNQKVRRFLATITAREMEVPIATVKATLNLRTNWDACVNYLRNFVRPIGRNGAINISAFDLYHRGEEGDCVDISRLTVHGKDKVDQGKRKEKGNKSEMKVEIADRYYKPEEWKWLVANGHASQVLELRKKRKGFDPGTGRRQRTKKSKRDA